MRVWISRPLPPGCLVLGYTFSRKLHSPPPAARLFMASVSLPQHLPAYVLGSDSAKSRESRDSLVSLDGGGDDEYTPLLKRACLHINQSGDSGVRFGRASTSVAARQFTVQYSSTLYTRLHKAKAKFESAIPKKWPGVPVKETLAVSADATAAQLAAVDAMHQAEHAVSHAGGP